MPINSSGKVVGFKQARGRSTWSVYGDRQGGGLGIGTPLNIMEPVLGIHVLLPYREFLLRGFEGISLVRL
ncbi:MAG: hypothetical protein H0W50_11615 [Parachlamydiaceae bacterium]|nr:hypothetical protein [Parachlamydiaceae bacterium]